MLKSTLTFALTSMVSLFVHGYDLTHISDDVTAKYKDSTIHLRSLDLGRLYGFAYRCMHLGGMPASEYLGHAFLIHNLISKGLLDKKMKNAGYVKAAYDASITPESRDAWCKLGGLTNLTQARANFILQENGHPPLKLNSIEFAEVLKHDSNGNTVYRFRNESGITAKCLISLNGSIETLDLSSR